MSVSLRQVANVLAVLLLIAIVAPFVVYAVPQTVGADHSFVVLTASMTPDISPGDAVIVAERDPATIREGEVVTFLRGNGEVPVTHRVVGVVESSDGVAFETKGDANDAPDAGLVPAENVLGVVLVVVPYIGYVIQFANTPYGFVALIAVPFGLLALNEAWTFYRRSEASGASFGDDGEFHGDESIGDSGAVPEIRDASVETDNAARSGEPATESSTANAPFVITLRTLEGAFLALLVFAPYAAYVAYNWRTTLPITVAFASGMTLMGVTATLLPAWIGRAGNDVADSVTPDGDDGTGVEGPVDATVAIGFDGGSPVSDEELDPEWVPAMESDRSSTHAVGGSGPDESGERVAEDDSPADAEVKNDEN